MAKRMLIEATHPEETRVVVVNGTRLEELDVETSTKKQLKGNIYLAKIVRVEPSLQAAFVDYGGNRHGFLAFSEIHPDYFQIPVADRQALLAAQRADVMRDGGNEGGEPETNSDNAPARNVPAEDQSLAAETERDDSSASDDGDAGSNAANNESRGEGEDGGRPSTVETVGGDDASEQELERRRARLLRNYKIQEVIKRRQILLVQVVKEERGNKGAALTTYLSLAGRYCVLMPNTARGGGVSRKIINAVDRRRLKSIVGELDIPDGMATIIRTAGSERSKAEIRRDYDYLLRAWDQVRELTLKSTAPALVYEEASLIKRSIRDLYSRDIDEVLVEGEEGYRLAKDYMRMLTPSHAKKVQPYREPLMPMFHRFQVENQLDAMHNPVVQLKSGGYLVIAQTEALVAIDVNSGRATKERHIEETALKTNLEAADEVARQLRLRDLAGLIVIDFIDMEESRNNHAVERRLKEALKNDRARIQVGKISPFGLLELSRQRLRPSLQETSFQPCPHCGGTGLVRSVESAAVHVLRAIEEEGIRRRSSEVTVYISSQIALYILNHKREALADIEARYQFQVLLLADDSLIAPNMRMERQKAENRPDDARPAISLDTLPPLSVTDSDDEDEDEDSAESDAAESTEAEAQESEANNGGDSETASESESEGERRRRRRRRRKRRTPGSDQDASAAGAEDETETGAEPNDSSEQGDAEDDAEENTTSGPDAGEGEDNERRRRRRGRRGGRRRRRDREGEETEANSPDAPQERPALPPVPAAALLSNPDAVADVFEAAEAAAEAEAAARYAAMQAMNGLAERMAEVTRSLEESAPATAEVAPGQDVVTSAPKEEAIKAASEVEAKPKRIRKPRNATVNDAEAGIAEEAPKAKAPRTRAPKKKVAPAAQAAAEQAVSVQEDAATKPKRVRKPKAAAESATEEAKPKRVRKPKTVSVAEPGDLQSTEAVTAPNESVVADAPVAETAPLPVSVAIDTNDEPPLPAKPARRGWWNRS